MKVRARVEVFFTFDMADRGSSFDLFGEIAKQLEQNTMLGLDSVPDFRNMDCRVKTEKISLDREDK